MNTIYLPNTQNIWDLLNAIEETHPDGQVITRETIEVKTENAAVAGFLKAIAAANYNGNGKAESLDEERICKRCKKSFSPIRANQYTCSPCLTEMARNRVKPQKKPAPQSDHNSPAADPS
jgi:protein-arginine kinase activator protein McsA